MSNYINHITLSTGHCRRSPRSEVDDATVQLLYLWLVRAIASGAIEPLPVAALSHFGARVIKEVGLVVTLYAPRGPHTKGQPHTGEHVPIATLGIAQRSREAKELWDGFAKHFGPTRATMPTTPYCMVAMHENIVTVMDALDWLGDLERCIAWAWVTRNPAIKPVPGCCQKCGYPSGTDWLDDVETCPRCKLVQ